MRAQVHQHRHQLLHHRPSALVQESRKGRDKGRGEQEDGSAGGKHASNSLAEEGYDHIVWREDPSIGAAKYLQHDVNNVTARTSYQSLRQISNCAASSAGRVSITGHKLV